MTEKELQRIESGRANIRDPKHRNSQLVKDVQALVAEVRELQLFKSWMDCHPDTRKQFRSSEAMHKAMKTFMAQRRRSERSG